MDTYAVAWISFWSAMLGGGLAIAGHFVLHWLGRRSDAEDRQAAAEDKIARLVLLAVNWFERDKQIVIAAGRNAVDPIELKHPVHALAAEIRISRPDLSEQGAALLKSSREYFDLTRILIPTGDPAVLKNAPDRVSNLINGLMLTLTTILDSVCNKEKKKPD